MKVYSERKLKEKSIMTNITSSFRRYRIVSANNATWERKFVMSFPLRCKYGNEPSFP